MVKYSQPSAFYKACWVHSQKGCWVRSHDWKRADFSWTGWRTWQASCVDRMTLFIIIIFIIWGEVLHTQNRTWKKTREYTYINLRQKGWTSAAGFYMQMMSLFQGRVCKMGRDKKNPVGFFFFFFLMCTCAVKKALQKNKQLVNDHLNTPKLYIFKRF